MFRWMQLRISIICFCTVPSLERFGVASFPGWGSIWSIWKARNDRVFNGTTITVDRLIFSIKVHAWWWFKARKKGFCFDLDHWILNPKSCIGFNT
jgi:hypothetical protein